MLLRSLPVYILKQLFFSISVNSGRIFCHYSPRFQRIIVNYNPSNIFACARLVYTRHVGEYSPAKTGEYPRIFPNFQNCARCLKDLKDNKNNSLHLGRKYARIFVLGHYLFLQEPITGSWFLVAHSFPRATLSENCSLLGTDNVHGQIS